MFLYFIFINKLINYYTYFINSFVPIFRSCQTGSCAAVTGFNFRSIWRYSSFELSSCNELFKTGNLETQKVDKVVFMYYISRSWTAPTNRVLLGTCKPNRPASLLWWRQESGWNYVLCISKTGTINILPGRKSQSVLPLVWDILGKHVTRGMMRWNKILLTSANQKVPYYVNNQRMST